MLYLLFKKILNLVLIKLPTAQLLAPATVKHLTNLIAICTSSDTDKSAKEEFYKLLKSLATTCSASLLYATLFGKTGMLTKLFETDIDLGQLNVKDPSGHAFFTSVAASVHTTNTTTNTKMTGLETAQKVYEIAWTLSICIVQIVTTNNFHTVGDMLAGLALVPIFLSLTKIPGLLLEIPWKDIKQYLKTYYSTNVNYNDEEFNKAFESFRNAKFTTDYCFPVDPTDISKTLNEETLDEILSKLDGECDARMLTKYTRAQRYLGRTTGHGVVYVNRSVGSKNKLCCKLHPHNTSDSLTRHKTIRQQLFSK